MTKEEVQQRVLQNGKPLDLDKFTWDKNAKIFLTKENDLFLDFEGLSDITFITGCKCIFKTHNNCKFTTESYCIFNTVDNCAFDTEWVCEFNTGNNCTFKTSSNCKFTTGNDCTFKVNCGCIFKTGWGCNFNTGNNCTFKTSGHCTFYTSGSCVFNTGSDSNFNTGNNCIFKTSDNCLFRTGYDSTFNTGWNCVFDTNRNCVIKVIDHLFTTKLGSNTVIVEKSFGGKSIKVYNSNDLPKNKLLKINHKEVLEKDLKLVELIDGYLEVILNKKAKGDITIRKTNEINDYFYNEPRKRYVVSKGEFNAHGETIKNAIKDLEFKILSSKGVEENVKRVLKDNKVTFNDYRLITGSCELGTKDWFDKNNLPYDMEVTVEKAIELVTKTNAYANDIFVEAIEKHKERK